MALVLNKEIKFSDKSDESKFNFFVDVAKAYENESGQIFLEGKASDTRVDQQKEKLSPNAIRSLKEQVDGSNGSIPVYPRHKSGWEDTLGYIASAKVDDDNNLFIVIELDATNQVALKLWKMISKGRQFGLSVGGFLRSAYLEYDREVNTIVKVLDDFEFDHVVVTTKPVNPRTWLHQIAKSLDEYMEEMPDGAEKGEDITMSEELESQLEEASVGESIDNSALGTNQEPEAKENKKTRSKKNFTLSELKVALESAESLPESEKELVAKDMATIIKLYGQIFPPMLAEEESEEDEMLDDSEAMGESGEESDYYDSDEEMDEFDLESDEIDDLHGESEKLRHRQIASMIGTASDLLEQALAAMAVTHPEIAVSEESQEIIEDGEEEAEHAGVDLRQELGMGEIQELIKHSLDKWLSKYHYNAIDVLPVFEDEDEMEAGRREVDKSMSKDHLSDDAFALVEEMADGTKIRKLPYKRKNGKIDKRHLALALATLNGANGGVDLSDEQRQSAYNVLSSAWEPTFGKSAPPLSGFISKAEPEMPKQLEEEMMESPAEDEGMDQFTDSMEQAPEEPQFDEAEEEVAEEEQVPAPSMGSGVEEKLDQLANAMAQLQEQVMNMQRMMVGINKSNDVNKELSQIIKKNELEVSKSRENAEENIKIFNDKIETVGNTVSKSIENLHHLAEKVDSLVKSQEHFAPVLKSLENLPIRKAIVVDKNEPFKVAKALPTNEPSFNNSKEREAWVFDQLKNIPI